MKHKEYLQNSGKGQRAIAYRFEQCGIGRYSADAELSEQDIEALNAKYGAQNIPRKVAQRSVSVPVTVAQTAPQTKAQYLPQKTQTVAQSEPQKEPEMSANKDGVIIFYASFAVAFISMALTCAGMYMVAWLIGLGLGLMFSLFMLVSVIAARNAETGDTSREALNTVLYLELGACLLHPYTFFTAFQKMGVRGDWYVLALAAVGCSIGVAVLSYNSVKLIRNYFAELNQAKLQKNEE